MNKLKSYSEKEQRSGFIFRSTSPFWHFCTPGNAAGLLFVTPGDIATAINLLGVCISLIRMVKIFAYAIMSNHIHLIMSGDEENCMEFFGMYLSKLKRAFAGNSRRKDLSVVEKQLNVIPIKDLDTLRKEIVYVNRNMYVVNTGCTPGSSIQTSGAIYFNPWVRMIASNRMDRLSVNGCRNLCKCRDISQIRNFHIIDISNILEQKDTDGKEIKMIAPWEICSISDGEAFFRDAHQYFNMLSRNYEAYSEVAKRLSEKAFITDEEMYSAVMTVCMKDYGVNTPSSLSHKDKIELAKTAKRMFNASNGQIRRIIRIDSSIIQELFPEAE